MAVKSAALRRRERKGNGVKERKGKGKRTKRDLEKTERKGWE